MRKLLLAIVSVALCAPATGARAYGGAELLYRFEDPAIVESSGCASSSRDPQILYTHNDSGDDARFFAVGAGGVTVSTIALVPPMVAADWEDMARGPGRDGKPALYFGDMGDNNHARPFITVYEVPEPATLAPQMSLTPSHAYNLVYPSPRHDAETLMVTPSGAIVVVTKEGNGVSSVYVARDPRDFVPTVMERVGTIDFPALFANPDINVNATGGDVSPDGSRIVVRTYDAALEWRVTNGDLVAAFASAPAFVELTETEQGEAICYTRDGRALLTTSEGPNAPVHVYR